jgi:hypothetical protein
MTLPAALSTTNLMSSSKSFHLKVCFLLTLAIIVNISFVLLSYLYLENDVPERPGIVIPLISFHNDVRMSDSASDTTSDTNSDTNSDSASVDSKKDQIRSIPSNSSKIDNSNRNNVTVWLAGIIIDTKKIKPRIWESMIHLNCKYNIGIHIVTKLNVELGEKKRDDLYHTLYNSYSTSTSASGSGSMSSNHCAPFMIHNQEDEFIMNNHNHDHDEKEIINRIDRLSNLRDYQRGLLLRDVFPSGHGHLDNNKNTDKNMHHSSIQNDDLAHDHAHDHNEGIIILADLDLYEFPSFESIFNQTQKMIDNVSYPHDAVCAIGTTLNFNKKDIAQKKMKRKMKMKKVPIPFYYDTYATIFLPDTFSYPLSRRLIPHYYHGEDPKLVRSNDQLNGNFTQADIWNYISKKGKQYKTGNVPVKSCFGGFAIYRSSVYFKDTCNYRLSKDIIEQEKYNDMSIMRYASSKEERPCEHIVFHDCLSQKLPSFDIAVNPQLITLWKRDT